MVVAGDLIPTALGSAMLDGLAAVRSDRRDVSLVGDATRLVRLASGLSLGLLVTGSECSLAELRAAASGFPSEVEVVMVKVDPRSSAGVRPVGQHALLTVPRLDLLPRLLPRVLR